MYRPQPKKHGRGGQKDGNGARQAAAQDGGGVLNRGRQLRVEQQVQCLVQAHHGERAERRELDAHGAAKQQAREGAPGERGEFLVARSQRRKAGAYGGHIECVEKNVA